LLNEKELGIFVTDTYRVLSLINQNTKNHTTGGSYSSITQKEISATLGFNIMKVNEIIQNLIAAGFLEAVPKHRGRYIVTEMARKIIKKFEK